MGSYDDLRRKKEELEAHLGRRLRPEGFTEFAQFVEKASTLRSVDRAKADELCKKAAAMLPRVAKSVERAISIRDQIKAKMIERANKAMDEYSDALKELSK